MTRDTHPAITDLGQRQALDVMDELIDVNGRFVIDVGCGAMHLARALAERGAGVLAVDPDPVQAAKNREQTGIPNVGFAETHAGDIPVESHLTDGVIFSNSLHHVPCSEHAAAIDETLRILKPDGFLYVLEPVAEGTLHEVIHLFHDETAVRAEAQQSLESLAVPRFTRVRRLRFHELREYADWPAFVADYAGKSFNSHYSDADIDNNTVRARFHEVGEPIDYRFAMPMQVTLLQQPRTSGEAPA